MSQNQPFGSLTPYAEPFWNRKLPSPYYNKPSHAKLRQVVRDWVEDNLMMEALDWEENGEIDHKTYKTCAQAGFLAALGGGARVPSWWIDKSDGRHLLGDIDPKEWDGFHDLIVNDEINRVGSIGVVNGLWAGIQIGLPPIRDYGSEELQKRVIPDIIRGDKRICLAVTEPEAGSDVKNLSTTAVKSSDGKHYIVNGSKKWITNGVYSDYFTTAVRTDQSTQPGDAKGISFLLIPRTKGVNTKKMHTGGTWSAGTTLVSFNDVEVPVENLIGEENQGFRYIMENFNHERLMIVFGANRLARVCLEDGMAYAHERRVFKGKLADLGVVRNKMAHIARVVEAQTAWMEALVYQLENLSHAEGNKLLGGATALMKANCSLVLELAAREAVQIHGGIGYTRGGKAERVERIWRDVKAFAIPGGSEEVMLDLGVRQQIKLALGQGAKL